jgi:hypothetical protein
VPPKKKQKQKNPTTSKKKKREKIKPSSWATRETETRQEDPLSMGI